MAARPDGGTDSEVRLTHLDDHGHARMVDVTAKPLTRRVAVARCAVLTTVDATVALGAARDGVDPMEAARIAGIQGAKQTSSLIPLCHPLNVDRVSLEIEAAGHRIDITTVVEILGRTGVEMEALTACAVAGLNLLDSLFDLDPHASLEDLTLWHKSGGRSGEWQRSGAQGHRPDPTASPTLAAGAAET